MYKYLIILICLFCVIFYSCNNKENKSTTDILAEVNNDVIYSSDLDNLVIQEVYDELNRIYTIKSIALNKMIEQKLVKQEAEHYNLTSEVFLNRYVDSVINNSSIDSLLIRYKLDKEINDIQRLSLLRLSPTSFEGRLLQKKRLVESIQKELIFNLINKSSVKTFLYPPKNPQLNLEKYSISFRGKLDSKVTMLLISDFDCGKCIDYHPIYDSIYYKYKSKVKFGYINYSSSPTPAIIASVAINSQNKFWDFHNRIYSEKGYIDSAKVFNIVKNMHIDYDRFSKEFNSNDLINNIEETFIRLQESGITATPSVIINNRLIYNSSSYDEIAKLLEIELK